MHTYTITEGGNVIGSSETLTGAARIVLQDDGGAFEIRREGDVYKLYTRSLNGCFESAGVVSRASDEAEAEREIAEFVCRRAFDVFGGFEVLTDAEFARQQAELAENDHVRCLSWEEQHDGEETGNDLQCSTSERLVEQVNARGPRAASIRGGLDRMTGGAS